MAALCDINSPERGVLLLYKNSKIVYANRRAAEIFGMTVGELLKKGLPSAVSNQSIDTEEVIDEVLDCLGNGSVFHRYSTPVYSHDGKVEGRIEIYSDITARRELEREILDRNTQLADLNQQLEEAQEQLVQSERLRALGEMAAGVAHDINNVLGIILGNAQLVKRKLDNNHPAMESVRAIELAARDAAETVRRLREIGKPMDMAGYAPVDLSNIVEDTIRAVIPAWCESANKKNEVIVDTDITPDCVIMGNAIELREALANVMLNAVQSIDDNGRITVRVSKDSNHADLTVMDTGSGMSEETQKRLFDPFFTTRGAEGTGLGMSMVDAIAIRHRGKVIVESEEGKGTSVTLRFPLNI